MLHLLNPDDPHTSFPDPEEAETEPNGLIAVGGDLSLTRLLNAYRHGIFPWYSEGQPILWWTPDPRMVLFPHRLRVSRSLRKTLKRQQFMATIDQAFEQVIAECAAPRSQEPGTWILPEMAAAYRELHYHGAAHSIEIWRDGALVGGLYGVALGRVFFGESMFSRVPDGSKVALVHLVNQLSAWNYQLIDCQVYTSHLLSMGAEEISRTSFSALLDQYCLLAGKTGLWTSDAASYPEIPTTFTRSTAK